MCQCGPCVARGVTLVCAVRVLPTARDERGARDSRTTMHLNDLESSYNRSRILLESTAHRERRHLLLLRELSRRRPAYCRNVSQRLRSHEVLVSEVGGGRPGMMGPSCLVDHM